MSSVKVTECGLHAKAHYMDNKYQNINNVMSRSVEKHLFSHLKIMPRATHSVNNEISEPAAYDHILTVSKNN